MGSKKRNTFKRRTFLRGMGGAVVGLPVLECMLNSNGTAYAQSGAIPRRYALMFAGQSIGGDGHAKDLQRVDGNLFTEDGHFIAPQTSGAGYETTTPLRPMEDAGLRGDYSIVTNLRIPFNATDATPNAVPTGGAFRDFHGGGSSPLLTGTRSTTPSYNFNGITSDQVIAALNDGQTTQRALVLRAQPSWYLSGSSFSGRQFISYDGPNSRVPAQDSPATAYQSLFSNFTPDDGGDAARFEFFRRARLSVLDLVTEKRQRLVNVVSAADRVRLEAHFDEIRALEQRISALPPVAAGECQVPINPGPDPAIGGDNAGSGSSEIQTNTGYSEEHDRARLMCDLIHMAFVCDLTRAASLQLTVFQSHMNVFRVSDEQMGLPILADLHEVGHNGDANNRGQQVVSTMLAWHISHYAYLVDKMKQTPEGGGSVLDNCALVFTAEGGHGTQLNDGVTENQTHSVENMAMLVAGRAGGLSPAGHVATAQAHPAQVLVSAMQGAGYTGDSLGEVTGNVPELLTS